MKAVLQAQSSYNNEWWNTSLCLKGKLIKQIRSNQSNKGGPVQVSNYYYKQCSPLWSLFLIFLRIISKWGDIVKCIMAAVYCKNY